MVLFLSFYFILMYKEFKIFVFLLSFALSLTTSFATTYYVIRESWGSCSEWVIADYNDLDQYSCEWLGNWYCAKVSWWYAKCYDDGDEDQGLSFVSNNCTNAWVFCKLQNMEITFNSLWWYNVWSIIIGKSNSRQYYEYFQLPIATRDGYIFKWWCRGNSSCSTALNWSEKYMPHQSRIYYAQWVQGYTVTYDTQQGDAIPSVTKESWQSVTLPTATRDGYIFKWWCKGETTCTSPLSSWENETVTENVTYYAQWEENYIPTASKYQKIYITWFNWDIPNQLIQTNNQEWDDLELYFLQSDWTTVKHFTIMDRNLWATEVYNREVGISKINTWSFWYHYQRGNNYGFRPCMWKYMQSCNGLSEASNSNKIEYSVWSAYSPSKYARNVWISASEWMLWDTDALNTANIWWWWWDTIWSNRDWTLIWSGNNWDSLSWRQWPCPVSYYIPSAYDWQTLIDAWKNSSVIAANTWIQFASDLFLSLASERQYGREIWEQGYKGKYWSSSPSTYWQAHYSYFWNTFSPSKSSVSRSNGMSIRCVKDSPTSTFIFTLHPDGWGKAVVAFTGTVEDGKFTTLWTPTKNWGYEFDWWYTKDWTSDDNWWNKLWVWSGVVANIYAKWSCPEWRIDKGTECTQPKNTVTFNYKANWWTAATSWSVEVISGDTLNLSLYTWYKENWDFVWWNTNSWATAPISEYYEAYPVTENITLYAIFKKDLKVTYLSWVWVASIWADSGSCAIYNTGNQCTVEAPTITLKDGYWTWIWSNWSNIVNSWSVITLTVDDTYTASATPNDNTPYKVEHYFENVDWTWFDIDNTLTDDLIWTTDTHTWAEYKVVTWFTWSSVTSWTESSGNIAWNGSLTLKLYYTRENYTLTFDSNSGSAVSPITAKYWSWITLPESTRTWYIFTWWKDENDVKFYSWDVYTLSWDTTLTWQWIAGTYVVTFDVNGWNALTPNTWSVTYDAVYWTLPTPSRGGYSFNGWFTAATNGTKITATTVVSATWDHTLYAQWTQNPVSWGSSSGWWGSRSNKTSDTSKDDKTVVDSSVDSQNNNNTQDSQQNEQASDNASAWQYNEEFQNAYEFAYKHGITTMPTIEQANMEGPLTRIAMAKMLSYYAINVLWLKPDETRVNKFNDVSDQMDAEYNNAVSLAYQLWIMWINMPKNNFRPNDLVTRWEFATALSRMLYKIADWKDKYYSTHLAKLMEEKIITNDNPNLQELRGYVMIMLMRSAK